MHLENDPRNPCVGCGPLNPRGLQLKFEKVGEEVRSTLPLPVLSAIPRITTEHDRTHGLRQRRWATAAICVGLCVVAGTSFMVAHDNEGLVALLTGSTSQTATASGR